MSFLSDAQEFPALVLTKLHVEMLTLNLQFFRLDDVIHFPGAADSTAPGLSNGRKIRGFYAIFWGTDLACRLAQRSRRTPGQHLDSPHSLFNGLYWQLPCQVATLAAQSTMPCACSNERARTCRSQPIRIPMNHRTVSAQRFPCQSNWSVERTIPTRRSVSADSRYSRPATCSRPWDVKCSPSQWSGSSTHAPIPRPRLVWSA